MADPPPPLTAPDGPEIRAHQALFTQSDWSGRVCRESWFGRHSPWWRIYIFMSLSSWCWTASTLYQLQLFQNSPSPSSSTDSPDEPSWAHIPIVLARTQSEVDRIKRSHQNCFESLCREIGRTVAIDCIVNDDGATSRVEYGEGVADLIQFTEACHVAVEDTFGDRFLDGMDGVAPPVAFLALQRGASINETTAGQRNPKREPSLLTLLPDCTITISDPEVSATDLRGIQEKFQLSNEWSDLYQEFQQQQQRQRQQHPQSFDISLTFDLMNLVHNRQLPPGHREGHILKNVFCVDEMPDDIQQQALPQLAALYNFVMDYRLEILTVYLTLFNFCFSAMIVAWLMARLILPSIVLKRTLPWPEKITTLDVWRTMLLLCLTTSFQLTSPTLAVFLALGAGFYGNFTAAMEWSFLGMLAWAANDTICPILDHFLGQYFARLADLDIVYYALHLFVVGEGWWKLVTVYVLYRAYRALFESLPPPPMEETQVYLHANVHYQDNGGGPEQQQEQQRIKVD